MRRYLSDLEFYRKKIGERIKSLSEELIIQDLEFQKKKPIMNIFIEEGIHEYHLFVKRYLLKLRKSVKKEQLMKGLLKIDIQLVQGFKIKTLQEFGI